MSDPRLITEEGVVLTSGARMPILRLGTWQARGRSAVDAVLCALEVGYRHIDTATAYGNEEQVGQAVARSGVPREEIFVTTKLPQSRAGRERATLEESLEALSLGYVDLWLVHWPPGGRARPDVWQRLLELQSEGLTREVGVSNYSVRQLDELGSATGRLPAVNQIEWSPALFDSEVLEAHRSRGVQLGRTTIVPPHTGPPPAGRRHPPRGGGGPPGPRGRPHPRGPYPGGGLWAISLGLWQNFGHDRPLENGRAIVRRAFDLGITHFDLANNYGPPYGSAEENFGRIFATTSRPTATS